MLTVKTEEGQIVKTEDGQIPEAPSSLDAANKEATHKGSTNTEFLNKGFLNKGFTNKGFTDAEFAHMESANKESANKESANKESASKESAGKGSGFAFTYPGGARKGPGYTPIRANTDASDAGGAARTGVRPPRCAWSTTSHNYTPNPRKYEPLNLLNLTRNLDRGTGTLGALPNF